MQTLDMGKPQTLGPPPRLRQHLLRNVDAGDPRIRAEMGKRQPGADADLEYMLARPIVGDAHRLFAPRVTCSTSMRGSASTRPVACNRPCAVSSFRVVAALPMSIWPQAIL